MKIPFSCPPGLVGKKQVNQLCIHWHKPNSCNTEHDLEHDFWHEGKHQKARFVARGKAPKSTIFGTKESTKKHDLEHGFWHEGEHQKARSRAGNMADMGHDIWKVEARRPNPQARRPRPQTVWRQNTGVGYGAKWWISSKIGWNDGWANKNSESHVAEHLSEVKDWW